MASPNLTSTLAPTSSTRHVPLLRWHPVPELLSFVREEDVVWLTVAPTGGLSVTLNQRPLVSWEEAAVPSRTELWLLVRNLEARQVTVLPG